MFGLSGLRCHADSDKVVRVFGGSDEDVDDGRFTHVGESDHSVLYSVGESFVCLDVVGFGVFFHKD